TRELVKLGMDVAAQTAIFALGMNWQIWCNVPPVVHDALRSLVEQDRIGLGMLVQGARPFLGKIALESDAILAPLEAGEGIGVVACLGGARAGALELELGRRR